MTQAEQLSKSRKKILPTTYKPFSESLYKKKLKQSYHASQGFMSKILKTTTTLLNVIELSAMSKWTTGVEERKAQKAIRRG